MHRYRTLSHVSTIRRHSCGQDSLDRVVSRGDSVRDKGLLCDIECHSLCSVLRGPAFQWRKSEGGLRPRKPCCATKWASIDEGSRIEAVWCARASGRLGVLDLRSWPILALRDEEAVQEVQDASGSYHGRRSHILLDRG